MMRMRMGVPLKLSGVPVLPNVLAERLKGGENLLVPLVFGPHFEAIAPRDLQSQLQGIDGIQPQAFIEEGGIGRDILRHKLQVQGVDHQRSHL